LTEPDVGGISWRIERASVDFPQPDSPTRPSGCHFRNRCPHEFARCTEHPDLEQRAEGAGKDRCWLSADQKKTLRVVETGEIGLEAKKDPAA
jgi:hypothetical protein